MVNKDDYSAARNVPRYTAIFLHETNRQFCSMSWNCGLTS